MCYKFDLKFWTFVKHSCSTGLIRFLFVDELVDGCNSPISWSMYKTVITTTSTIQSAEEYLTSKTKKNNADSKKSL
jgi:hypothetical protein